MLKVSLIVIGVIALLLVVFVHWLFFALDGSANASLDLGAYGRWLLKITGRQSVTWDPNE